MQFGSALVLIAEAIGTKAAALADYVLPHVAASIGALVHATPMWQAALELPSTQYR